MSEDVEERRRKLVGYLRQEAWRDANLPRCPVYPGGGDRFARYGAYERVSPPVTLIVRWYCPAGHRSFSLLPDFLAARLSGTLAEVKAAVRGVASPVSKPGNCG